MNAPVYPEVLLRRQDADIELPLATEGVRRYLWESRYGDILIEVIGEAIFVNGSKVVRFEGPELPSDFPGARQP